MAPKFADIAVDAPIQPGLTLTYAIPSNVNILRGQVVWVPLASRRVSGIVFGISDSTEILGVREVLGPLDPMPILDSKQLELAEWLSGRVLCSLFEAASLMLPIEFRRKSRSFIRLSPQATEKDFEATTSTEFRLLTYLGSRNPIEEKSLLARFGHQSEFRKLLRQGLIIREWKLQPPSARAKFKGTLTLRSSSEDGLPDPKPSQKLSPKAQAVLEKIGNIGSLDIVAARKEFGHSVVASLISRGLLENQITSEIRDPLRDTYFPPDFPFTLTEEQETAINRIQASLEETPTPKVFLLEGVTGSGKTEIYLQALAFAINRGKRGLFLVPEISLTPQLIQRLSSRFPGRVGVWHSGLTAGQQYDTWWRILKGDFDIVLGSRSAIFTPVKDLGIIVIDEEHEWAYKQQDPSPRYHVRSVAEKLMEIEGAVLILGSATPDVETYYKGLKGDYEILRLKSRIISGSTDQYRIGELATVKIVDMREELKVGVRSIFSRMLEKSLVETLDRGEQAILFLNRRGSSWSIQCRDCGHVLVCRGCNAPLNYHGLQDKLVCHYCGRSTKTQTNCPRCKGPHIRYLGLGTQRVVQEVEQKFGVKALQWDRDTTSRTGEHSALMKSFARGDFQVLVGTQMIAKGLDLPQVTLVGAMLADLGLFIPDFRAGERGFQLLYQVAGRAGRGEKPGLAIVQTYHPEHYAIQAAARQEFGPFYDMEIGYRQTFRNPPFSQIAKMSYQHTNPVHARNSALEFVSKFRNFLTELGISEIDVIGPAPGYPPRLRGKNRWQALIRVPNGSPVSIQELLRQFHPHPDWVVDIDPITVL